MSLIERCPVCGCPDVCCGQRDMLATQVLALENVGMDQAERLGEAEHQLAGAVEALRQIAETDDRNGVIAANALADLGVADPLLDRLGGQ